MAEDRQSLLNTPHREDFANGARTIRTDSPFWTWFIDNQQPSPKTSSRL
jgi:hypothetical protein